MHEYTNIQMKRYVEALHLIVCTSQKRLSFNVLLENNLQLSVHCVRQCFHMLYARGLDTNQLLYRNHIINSKMTSS